jgi:hypothetical protein
MNAPLNPSAAVPPEAVRWLANGRRGVSSNSFISAIYGIDANGDHYRDAPHDPSDLRRCRLMVESIPGAKELLLSLVDPDARQASAFRPGKESAEPGVRPGELALQCRM